MSVYSPKIYRINENKFESKHPKQFIEDFMESYNRTHNTTAYEKKECREFEGAFQVMFYMNDPKWKPPSWIKVAKEASIKSENLNGVKNRNYAFLMFFYSNDEIYSITGGHSGKIIDEIIDYNFGFNIVERIIDPKKTEIRAMSQRGFVGIELASSKFFKSNFVFYDNDDFGKFYRGLEAFISEKKLLALGVITKKKNLLVKGETGFKVDTDVDLDVLLNRISKLSRLLKREIEPDFEINPFRSLRPKELSAIVKNNETLEEVLDRKLFLNYFEELKTDSCSEIFHPNLIEYLRSDLIVIQKRQRSERLATNQKITLKTILRKIGPEPRSLGKDEFIKAIKTTRTFVYNNEVQQPQLDRKLSEWLMGDVPFNDERYIKFEGVWYTYTSNFLSNLNARLDAMFERIEVDENLPIWEADETNFEGDYNEKAANHLGALLGDEVFHDYIEIADLIAQNKNEIVIYHVKKDLDRNLRVLQSQILNSARVLFDYRANNIEEGKIASYFNKVLKQTSNKTGRKLEFENVKNDFLRKDNIRYVFAFATFTDSKTKGEILNEIKNSRSAIAKISILHTYYSLKAKEINFSIAKIIRKK